MEDPVKKRRGRKPKNFYSENVPKQEVLEKKKRGRKKKYEIENSDKILNRNEVNNFDHHIAYSDDDITEPDNNQTVKKVAFGNLDITISKVMYHRYLKVIKIQSRLHILPMNGNLNLNLNLKKPLKKFIKKIKNIFQQTT